jgi:hypothetical protein
MGVVGRGGVATKVQVFVAEDAAEEAGHFQKLKHNNTVCIN